MDDDKHEDGYNDTPDLAGCVAINFENLKKMTPALCVNPIVALFEDQLKALCARCGYPMKDD